MGAEASYDAYACTLYVHSVLCLYTCVGEGTVMTQILKKFENAFGSGVGNRTLPLMGVQDGYCVVWTKGCIIVGSGGLITQCVTTESDREGIFTWFRHSDSELDHRSILIGECLRHSLTLTGPDTVSTPSAAAAQPVWPSTGFSDSRLGSVVSRSISKAYSYNLINPSPLGFHEVGSFRSSQGPLIALEYGRDKEDSNSASRTSNCRGEWTCVG
jgi:hypothetical protein